MLNRIIPANIYLFKVNNKNTRKRFICSKLTIKTAKWRQWRRSGVFIANFERISHLFLMFICWVWAEYLLGLHCHIFFSFFTMKSYYINPSKVNFFFVYRNQSIDLLCKSIMWFLFEGNIGHGRVKVPRSVEEFFSKYEQIRNSCGFVHIY